MRLFRAGPGRAGCAAVVGFEKKGMPVGEELVGFLPHTAAYRGIGKISR